MTKDQAKNILLKQALVQAQNTVEFLHNCLIQSKENGGIYSYVYPEHTEKYLKEWADLAPKFKGCFHSGHDYNCESCQNRVKSYKERTEAQKVLGIE